MKKSGNKSLTVTPQASFTLADYADAHGDRECKGSFKVMVSENVPYPVDALGPVMLPVVPHIACEECQAAYPVPGWDEFLDRLLSVQLLGNGRLLTKSQARFLRLASGLTQVQVADRIGMEKTLFNKKESASNQAHQFNASEQVQLKLLFAKMLGIKEASYLYDHIMKLEDTPSVVTVSREEVEKFPPLKCGRG